MGKDGEIQQHHKNGPTVDENKDKDEEEANITGENVWTGGARK